MDRFHPEDQATLGGLLARLESGDPPPGEHELRLLSGAGQEEVVRCRFAALELDEAGAPALMGGALILATAEVRAAQRLEASESQLRDLASSLPGAVFRYVLHPDGSDAVQYMSSGCYALWELHAEDVVEDARPLWAQIDPEDVPRVQASVQASARDLTPWIETWRIETPSGKRKWVGGYGAPRRLPNGDVLWNTVILDHTERHQLQADLDRALRQTIAALASMVERRDPYTAGHQQRVARIAVAIGHELGWSPDRVEVLELAALVHDVGKIQVPAELLTKPTALTHIEFELIKTHAEAGASLLAGIDFPWPLSDIVAQHHERLDGSGYPLGLRGVAIQPEARVLAAADTIEAMATDRPYRRSPGLAAALDVLREGAGKTFDPDVVRACLALADRGELPLR